MSGEVIAIIVILLTLILGFSFEKLFNVYIPLETIMGVLTLILVIIVVVRYIC